ncbi:MAG: hypothetical protein ACOYJ6_19130 [Caulobacterales bacterium]|jgi:hypothetical protein
MQTKSSWEVSKKESVTDDKTLRDWVIDELDWDPSIDASSVGVAVADGVVCSAVMCIPTLSALQWSKLYGASKG